MAHLNDLIVRSSLGVCDVSWDTSANTRLWPESELQLMFERAELADSASDISQRLQVDRFYLS